MQEIKADKYPIGGLQTEHRKEFTSHTIELNEGDTFYIFSDGYADQFGGPSGKKFMTKQMKELLASISHLPMHEQCTKLDRAVEEWKGSIQQVDDILVIGVRMEKEDRH